MQSLNSLKTNVFSVDNQNFDQYALELFQFQYKNNRIYNQYVEHLNVHPHKVTDISQIPFLPIQFFKNHNVKTGDFIPEHMFVSSGTTGTTSKHYIEDLAFYKKVSTHIFNSFLGNWIKPMSLGYCLPTWKGIIRH